VDGKVTPSQPILEFVQPHIGTISILTSANSLNNLAGCEVLDEISEHTVVDLKEVENHKQRLNDLLYVLDQV
jgi:hypothetical protein